MVWDVDASWIYDNNFKDIHNKIEIIVVCAKCESLLLPRK